MADIKFLTVDDEGDEIEISLPAKYEVCGRCRGTGKHVNPAIDGNGLSREDFDEDPDFEEAYFSGHYDVRCQDCDGMRVSLEIDVETCERTGREADLKAYYEYQRSVREVDEMIDAERRMGA